MKSHTLTLLGDGTIGPNTLFTPEEVYELYIALGKYFFEVLQPTRQEIVDVNEEAFDIGMEDLLCHPDNPTAGGDIGLLACWVYEHRDAVRAEEGDNG